MTETPDNLPQDVETLLETVQSHQERQCREIAAAADKTATEVVAKAHREARQRVRRAIEEERRQGKRALEIAGAKIDTARRQKIQEMEAEALRQTRERLT